MPGYSYLALGDSYTIGEQVRLTGSFPYQAVQLLRQLGLDFSAPEIIATTGWTTEELAAAIDANTFLSTYDFITLLIGVNNQYRGRTAQSFAPGFETLVETAINLTTDANRVIVLSIPDWGVTPFASGKDARQIAAEIDAYNMVCKTVAASHDVHWIDITTGQRIDGANDLFLAPDGLHPSAEEYAKWAKQLCDQINQVITNNKPL